MLLEVDNLAENYIQPWKLTPQESYSGQSYSVQKVEQNVHQHSYSSFQLMMKIEIANYIHRCIILINDTHLFHKELINGLPFHVQSTFASIDHLDNHYELIQIVNSQPTTLQACQHSNYAKTSFNFILRLKNFENFKLGHKRTVWKLGFMGFPPSQGQHKIFRLHMCKW